MLLSMYVWYWAANRKRASDYNVSTSVWQIEQLAVVSRDRTHSRHVDSATLLTNKRRLLPVVLSLKKKTKKKRQPLLQMSSKTELSLLKLKWECAEWEEELERKQREESLAELPEGRPEFTATERGNGKIKEGVCYHRESHVLTWCCQYNKTCT